MRSLVVVFLTLCALTACGPARMGQTNSALAGSTGYFNANHIDDVHNGDAYVLKRQREMEKNPSLQTPPAAIALNARLKQFEMTRFNADQPDRPALFGNSTFKISVFFTDAAPVTFSGRFDARLHFSTTAAGYRLEGDLRDFRSQGLTAYENMDRTSGVIYLTSLGTKAPVEISYRGLRKKKEVYRPLDQKLSASVEAQVEQIEKTALWENNWTIVSTQGGKSFFLNDFILPKQNGGDVGPLLAFGGESQRTSTENQAYTFAAESLTKSVTSEVTMVGNSEVGGKRAYQIALNDSTTKEKYDILVYTEPEHADPADSDETSKIGPGAPFKPEIAANDPISQEPLPPAENFSAPNPRPDTSASPNAGRETKPSLPSSSAVPLPPTRPEFRPNTPASPASVAVAGPYIPIHRELPLTGRMDADIRKNYDVPGVRDMIANFQGVKRTQKAASPLKLRNFFDNAYPFRALISAIAQAFDSNPIYVYLAVDETDYFVSGNYQIQPGDGGDALGPFQFHEKAARESKLVISGKYDERAYFAPSACGGARYLAGIVRDYARDNMDTTLALMGYNQGATGARNYARRFGVRWKLLDGARAGVPEAVRNYVNSKIAIYLIASNRAYYGFPLTSPNQKTNYPRNGSVFPSSIGDPVCRQVVASIRG